MNNADLVWRLIEMLLQKENELNQSIKQNKMDNQSNDQKQDEA